jgi:DNA-directed RNA polymerase specialized sigma24 family protein
MGVSVGFAGAFNRHDDKLNESADLRTLTQEFAGSAFARLLKWRVILLGENRLDERLLAERPDALMAKYQEIIKIIVKKYIATKMFHASDFEDIVQMVNEDILKKIGTIQKQYNGKALLKTYFSAIVRNSCLKIYQKQCREMKMLSLEEEDSTEEETVTNHLEIEYDLKRIERILGYYAKKQGRVLLCAKLCFQIPIERKDILHCFSSCSEEDITMLLDQFGFHQERRLLKQVYHIITPILNKYEGKNNTEDAVRRWTEDRREEIVRLLNAAPHCSTYDKETLKILFEMYSSI